jgi:hypothetical protein
MTARVENLFFEIRLKINELLEKGNNIDNMYILFDKKYKKDIESSKIDTLYGVKCLIRSATSYMWTDGDNEDFYVEVNKEV